MTQESKQQYNNKCEKKSQENDSGMLRESQENIFRSVSSSSQSTDIGDFKELTQHLIETCTDNAVGEEPRFSTYDLRTRSVLKEPRKKLMKTQMDSAKLIQTNRQKTHIWAKNFSCTKSSNFIDPISENTKMEEDSQESVSMLQECYREKTKDEFPELMETCLDSELEISYISDEEDSPGQDLKVESSTQTDFLVAQNKFSNLKEREIAKQASFINCIVQLKTFLSSKETTFDKTLWDVMQLSLDAEHSFCLKEIEEHTICTPIPKEAIGYLLRGSDVQKVFQKTVQTLLHHLEEVLRDDFLKIACCWKNSVYEMAVEMLSQVVDSEVGVWKMVDLFLSRVIESILNEENKFKHLTLEAKTSFVINFCQSTHLSYTVINCVMKNLEGLKMVTIQVDSSATDKLSSACFAKNAYFLLRILEDSLKSLGSKVEEGKIQEMQKKEPEGNNYNVLEMWKKHWNKNEVLERPRVGHQWETMVSKWCEVLDEILLHCVNHLPVLSLAVERCAAMTKQILNLCHPEVNL